MQFKSLRNRRSICVTAAFIAATFSTINAQQTLLPALPDSPGFTLTQLSPAESPSSSSSVDNSTPDDLQSPQPTSENPHRHIDAQPKRILGIIPNFRAVTAGTKLPPQTVKDKFVTASEDSFDYSSLFFPAAIAGYSLIDNSVPEFGGGAVGYGRYFWHTFTDQTIENYMVEFVVPAIHHEDTRYYTLGDGGFLKRAGYAVKHVIITQSDSGKPTFNAGEVVGAGVSAGLSNLYYPASQRTLKQTGDRWALNVGIDAFTFAFKEFWPNINHALFERH